MAENRVVPNVVEATTENPIIVEQHKDDDDFVDPMEEAYDNMQHPMELMLLIRACIPYVTM